MRFRTRRGWRFGPLCIAEFARVGEGSGYPLSLQGLARRVGGSIPRDALAIGQDLGGDPIYIYVRGPRRGEVCTAHVSRIASWHDIENSPDEADGEQFIAKDFADVIEALEKNAQPSDTRPRTSRKDAPSQQKRQPVKPRKSSGQLRFTATIGPESKASVRAFEQDQRITLPADYRRFLCSVGGGTPQRSFLDITNPPRHEPHLGGVVIGSLHHLTRKGRVGSVASALQSLQQQLPRGTLPIGRCADGSSILIYISGPRRGQVWSWDREHAIEGQAGSGMTLLRSTFTQFLNALMDDF